MIRTKQGFRRSVDNFNGGARGNKSRETVDRKHGELDENR